MLSYDARMPKRSGRGHEILLESGWGTAALATSGVGLLIMLSEFFLRLSCFSCGELTWHIRYSAYYKLYHFLYTRIDRYEGLLGWRPYLATPCTPPPHFVALFLAATVWREICPAFIRRNSVWAGTQAAALCMWQPHLWCCGACLQTKQALNVTTTKNLLIHTD